MLRVAAHCNYPGYVELRFSTLLARCATVGLRHGRMRLAFAATVALRGQ